MINLDSPVTKIFSRETSTRGLPLAENTHYKVVRDHLSTEVAEFSRPEVEI